MVAEYSPRRLRISIAGRCSTLPILSDAVEPVVERGAETGATSRPAVTIPKGRPKAREPITSKAKKLSPAIGLYVSAIPIIRRLSQPEGIGSRGSISQSRISKPFSPSFCPSLEHM